MAGEIQGSFAHAQTVYALVRDRNGNIWSTLTNSFGAYVANSYSGYPISTVEQGSSAYYVGNFPAAAPPGVYNVVLKNQLGANPAESDPTTDAGSIDWNGLNVAQLSDLAQSGVINPTMLPRGWMVKNFYIYLKSAADHVTPFTSGIVSGQISHDGGLFGPLQSGAFSEVGHGMYALQALTSGDLLANTVALLFTAQGISGGACDPLPMSFIMQRTSGQ